MAAPRQPDLLREQRLRHTPVVPYLYATPSRPRRRARRARQAMVAVAAAIVVMLVLPGAGPRGEVLDLTGGPQAAQGPATAIESASPTSAPSPIAAPVESAVPVPTATLEPAAPAVDTLTGYQWPIAHPRLTLPFGPTPWGSWIVDGQPFHDGVDLATFCGDRVTAAHHGWVIAAGRHYDRLLGWVGDLSSYFRRLNRKHLWFELPIVVIVDDGNGYRSVYAHFERIVVQVGQEVQAGQLLGYEGATGHATGCHLHYGLFSPLETATFKLPADVAKRMKLPRLEIARIDPLQVLPPKAGITAPSPSTAPGAGASPPGATSP